MKNNIKVDSAYVNYKEHFDKLDRTENYREELAAQFLELCEFKKESFKDDIASAVYEISKTNVGLELLYTLVDKIVSTDKKVVFMKSGNMLGFSDDFSKINGNIVIHLEKDFPSEIQLGVKASINEGMRKADFSEILFHELCHVMHYMFVDKSTYSNRLWSTSWILAFFYCDNKIEARKAWSNDEELYTVTGLSFHDVTKELSYNPINENAYANELNLSIRGVYNNSYIGAISELEIIKIYKSIGFYVK